MMSHAAEVTAALADRYRVERELGAGGMATVYLAQDLKHHRPVAIKVLRPELAQAVGGERFLREINIAAQLQSPHILPLLESGEADGLLFYVMPIVKGSRSGTGSRSEGALAPSEGIRLLRDIVDGLAHAHRSGVVHRDIKPDNVMIADRHAVVVDFGVAKAISGATVHHDLTSIGISLGTPAYMAPEQAAADPNVDHRADIYSVGVLAYEMLSGGTPFSGPPQAVLAAHITTALEPLEGVQPAVSPGLLADRHAVSREGPGASLPDGGRAVAGDRVAGDAQRYGRGLGAESPGPRRQLLLVVVGPLAVGVLDSWACVRWNATAGCTRRPSRRCDG